MDGVLDLISKYRWVYVAGSGTFFSVALLLAFRHYRALYRSWLHPEYPWTTRLLARVGLLGSWGFVVAAVAAWVILVTLAAVDKETLRLWVATGMDAAGRLAGRSY